MDNRRTFLRQLTGLPLVGGSVALIGQPTAVAQPITPSLIEAYKTWLDGELANLCWEMAGDPAIIAAHYGQLEREPDRSKRADFIGRVFSYVGRSHSFHSDGLPPSTRAALVLSTVGCDWREDGQ